MNKNVLLETVFKPKFKVLNKKPANVLKRIQGVLSDFKSNRNGRVYPRELWENVLNSDYVKEMIESHGLVGELDHPEERLEISLQNVSHVINNMWIEGDQVLGIIDILPTPSGKIVSDLLDYGTDIGISSRGAGSVGADNVVDPDYQFVTFDFVARPSCEAARLNTILESVQTEIDNNSDDKVNAILESYKDTLKEDILMDEYKLNGDDQFRYMMLSRLQSDCKYVLGQGNGNMKVLWVNNDPVTHCALMRELYNSLEDKPDWITPEEIDNYEKEMLALLNKENINESSNLDKLDKIRKTLSSDDAECLDMVLNDIEVDPKTCAFSDLEDAVHESVSKFNEANSLDEYKDEDSYNKEYDADKIYTAIVKLYGRDKEIESSLGYRPKWLDESVYIIKQDAGHFGTYTIGEWKADSPEQAINEFLEDNPKYKDGHFGVITAILKENDSLSEAAMSDQEVYKTVLEWYKGQIEAGKMSLNQCYELLSDKAKVSLNKMVDQSKIKESMINKTINKLIKESIELNEEVWNIPIDKRRKMFKVISDAYGKEYASKKISDIGKATDDTFNRYYNSALKKIEKEN